MIGVDTSAIVAIIAREVDSDRLRTTLEASRGAVISTANLLELQLVLGGRRAIAPWSQVEDILTGYDIATIPFTEHQLRIAREAAMRYGKGRHKAGLNYGDCFAYALAKSEDVPLLCTGSDFALTDIAIA